MRRALCLMVAVILAGVVPQVHGQANKAEIENKLKAKFVETRFTGDRTDILKAGSVLVFQKKALVMFSIDNPIPPTSNYQNGKLTMGFGTSMEAIKTGDDRVPQRTFVESEKFWLSDIDVEENAVFLTVISDPYNDVRYYTKLKFPFNKKAPPSADDVVRTVSEVIAVDGGGDQQAAQAPAPAAVPAPSQTALAPIAPPPPPVDAPPAQPKTIALGQTTDMVEAIMGQPDKKVNLATKTLYIYKDLKVTFIKGKVTDVQ
jgi:hypothetical protein